MQQILEAHNIPTRIVDQGISAYLGVSSPANLQVQSHDQWTARLLLSSPAEHIED